MANTRRRTNAEIVSDDDSGDLWLNSTRDIHEGQEILVDYGEEYTFDFHHRSALLNGSTTHAVSFK